MTRIIRALIVTFLISVSLSCAEKSDKRVHYFLDGYDELEFRDKSGNPVLTRDFIGRTSMNGYRYYQIRDISLTLVYKRSGDTYSGYIRTFHRDRYNIQGEFKDGKIFRLRYWHPNRTIAMDHKFEEGTLSLWDSEGSPVVSANDKEHYYYYTGSQAIKEIINDTMHSYFNRDGELERYNIYKDSASIFYDGDGNVRRYFSYKEGVGLHGAVKEWHSNRQLKVVGNYVNGQQSGTWIEYDSLGNEIKREEYGTP